eukprot:TRINITY_DN36935_c0_g1_i1.p1 TRINITY_DN36935_c0_g1~~TRINITY_DN36935_c0_g1_i1.p1  ORF type:complete len:522 (+),score=147.02 TRINITY_DN36935_c0_g1_i1:40-1566(+)
MRAGNGRASPLPAEREDDIVVPGLLSMSVAGAVGASHSPVTPQSPAFSRARSQRSAVSRLTSAHAASTITRAEMAGVGKAGLLSCVANMASSMIGAGVLGLPFAIADCGLVLGLALMAACCCLCCTSLWLLACCARVLADSAVPASFYAAAVEAGPQWCLIVDLAVLVSTLGGGCSYLIVAGDMLPRAVQSLGDTSAALANRRVWVLAAFALVTPLACLPRLDLLRYTSSASVCFVTFVTVLLTLYACGAAGLDACDSDSSGGNGSVSGGSCEGEIEYARLGGGMLRAFPVFVFSFVAHQNMFTICTELRDPTPARVQSVIVGGGFLALATYAGVCVSAYVVFGSNVASDMLNSYPDSNPITAARLCMALLASFAYPLQAHPGRRSAMSLWHQITSSRRVSINGSDDECPDNASLVGHVSGAAVEMRYWACTAAFLGFTVVVALLVRDLGVALDVTGAVASVTIGFIMPGVCYTTMHPYPHFLRTVAIGISVFGLLLCPSALVATFVF